GARSPHPPIAAIDLGVSNESGGRFPSRLCAITCERSQYQLHGAEAGAPFQRSWSQSQLWGRRLTASSVLAVKAATSPSAPPVTGRSGEKPAWCSPAPPRQYSRKWTGTEVFAAATAIAGAVRARRPKKGTATPRASLWSMTKTTTCPSSRSSKTRCIDPTLFGRRPSPYDARTRSIRAATAFDRGTFTTTVALIPVRRSEERRVGKEGR